MAEDPTNLVLEELQYIRAAVDEFSAGQQEFLQRLTRLDEQLASMCRDRRSAGN